MARREITTLVDDIDGGPAAETVDFELDGKRYEIDLSRPHATQLRDALGPYVDHGRKMPRGQARSRTHRGTSSPSTPKAPARQAPAPASHQAPATSPAPAPAAKQPSKQAPTASTASGQVDGRAVREWARSQGIEVKDLGRLPADLVAQYRAATGK